MTWKNAFLSAERTRRQRPGVQTPMKRARRQAAVECLEERTLLTYTFSYNPVTQTALALGDAAQRSLVIEPVAGFLEYSVDGSPFSGDWGGLSVPAIPTVTVNVLVSSGDGSSLTLGTPTGPASLLLASFSVGVPANTLDTLTVDDSKGTTLASSIHPYVVNLGSGSTISGPGIVYQEPVGRFSGGVRLKGSDVKDNVYSLVSTFLGEPVAVQTSSLEPSGVTIGNASNTVSSLQAPLSVTGEAAIVIKDTGDTSNATATLDKSSGDPSAPYQVSGLSPASIRYGSGVTSLEIDGGTSGAAGVTYNINATQSGTTTRIVGGALTNNYKLSNAALVGGLDNLLGSVEIHAGSSNTDSIELNDSSANFNDNYTVSSTSLSRTGLFAGMSLSGTISELTLFAENTLGTNGNNTITINGTPDGAATVVDGQGGVDTITVNGTGSGGFLIAKTGSAAGSVVNIIANTQPVTVSSAGSATVNIGSTGGAGTVSGIQGAISVINPPNLTSVNFHDENNSTARSWTIDNNDGGLTGSIAATGIATTTIDPTDISSLTVNGGSGGNGFTLNNTSAFFATTLNTGSGKDTVNVFGTGANTLNIHGQDGADVVTLGNSSSPTPGMQGLNGTINVDNTLGFTSLTLDDAKSSGGRIALLFNDGTNGQVTGLAPATINYVDRDTSSFTVLGGGGANHFDVNGTLANASFPGTPNLLDKGTGSGNVVHVMATMSGSELTLAGGGFNDIVTVGSGNKGRLNVDEVPGSTALTVDLSNDGLSHVLHLSSDGTRSTLHDTLGNLAGDITYITRSLTSITINTDGRVDQTLNLDFGQGGNPIPVFGLAPTIVPFIPGNPATLFYNSGAPSVGVTHSMNIFGELGSGPFTEEVHNANDPTVSPTAGQHGSIFFLDADTNSTGLNYTGLQPITDIAPALGYTFNDLAVDQSFTASTGPVVSGSQTIRFANTPPVIAPTFETTDIANKTNVVFNTPNQGTGLTGVVNIPTASAGLVDLTFNTFTNEDNTVTVLRTPAAVATTVNGSAEEDVTNVTGRGVATGTTLVVNGGGGFDTLNFDAGGLIPTVTAGGASGELLITLPGFGTVDAIGYKQVNLTNLTTPIITPGTAASFKSAQGQNVVDAVVGKFTMALPTIGTVPAGLPASAFTASLNWNDPTSSPGAGTVTQDASSPSVYYISGTHTFATQGTFGVTNSVTFAGATYGTSLNGVPISITLAPSGPTAGTPATATIINAAITVTTYPLVGIEGQAISPGPIATFFDMGGAGVPSDYSSEIVIIDAAGNTVLSTTSTTILQVGNSAQYFVMAPAITLPEAGTYRLFVLVSDQGLTGPILQFVGGSTATAVDAPLSPSNSQPNISTTEAALFPVPVFGTPIFSGPVASFTDANPTAPIGDFTASIDWGDGTWPTVGRITQPGGVGTAFIVSGSHTYADSGTGSYSVRVQIQDTDGARLTVTNIASVADRTIPLVGQLNPASDSGKFNNDGVTNVTQPNFFGTSEPHSHIQLFANGVPVGQTQSGSDGSWSITSGKLADGVYAITATATDQFGASITAAPVPIISSLLIDTVAPRITFASFDRFGGRLGFIFQDSLADGTPGGSGMLTESLSDSANYSLNRVHVPRVAGRYIVSSINVAADSNPFAQDVSVVFNNGHYNGPNWYRIMARAAGSTLPSGIQDLAGNALDGEFYGQSSASGNGVAGGDFAANVKSFQKTPVGPGYSGPLTIIGYPHPNDPAGRYPVAVIRKTSAKPLPKAVTTTAKPKVTVSIPKIKPLAARH